MMTSGRPLIWFVVTLSMLLSLPLTAQSDSGSIHATSNLTPKDDDPEHLTASCSTSFGTGTAEHPSAIADEYKAVYTSCKVVASDGSLENSLESSSNGQKQCSAKPPVFYPSPTCEWKITKKPGVTYRLEATHYLQTYWGAELNAPAGAATCAPNYFWDPESWRKTYQQPANDNNSGLGGWVSDLSSSAAPLPYAPGYPMGCIAPSDTVGIEGGTGAIAVATTHATFTTLSVKTLLEPSISELTLLQTQMADFVSNYGNDSSDPITWCVQTDATNCNADSVGLGMMTSTATTATYTAVLPVQDFNSSSSTAASYREQAFVCAQENSNTNNFACATLHLRQVVAEIEPGSTPNAPIKLQPLQTQPFTGVVTSGFTEFDSPVKIKSWLWNADGNVVEGHPVQDSNVSSFSEDAYTYTAPASDHGLLALNVVVDLTAKSPAYGGSGSYPLMARAYINISANLTPQTVSFSTISTQVPGAVVPLVATASSGLLVQTESLTPQVCSVESNIVTMAISGTCTLAAVQPGNSIYAAATSTQSFTVSGRYQAPSAGSILITTQPEPPEYMYAVDQGTVSVTVSGITKGFGYAKYSTPAAIAAGLAAYFSEDPTSPFVAKATGAVVTFYPRGPGAGTFSASTSVVSQPAYVPHPAFAAQVQ